MPARTRETETTAAKARKNQPARRDTKNTPNAIERAAVAWSLGKDGSAERGMSGTMLACASYGRARSHRWEMTWFAASPTAAADNPAAHARFHAVSPGGESSQSPTASTPKTGTPQVENSTTTLARRGCTCITSLIQCTTEYSTRAILPVGPSPKVHQGYG